MMRWKWLNSGLMLVALGLASPVRSQDSPLAQVPATAPVVVYVHGLERTKDRVITMVKNAIPDLGGKAQAAIEDGLKEAAQGRSFAGLAPEGAIFFVMAEFPKGGEPPAGAVIAQVKSYSAFKDGILNAEEKKALKADPAGFEQTTVMGSDLFLVDKKGYAVLTPSKEVATQFTKAQPGLDGKLSKPAAQRLLDSDVGLYVNLASVNKEFGGQIQLGQTLVEGALQQGGIPGLQASQAEIMKKAAAGLFQVIKDSTSVQLYAEFRPEGLAIRGEDLLSADSETNKFLKGLKPSSLKELDSLTAGMIGYTAMKLDPALTKSLQTQLFGVTEVKDNKEFQDGLATLIDADLKQSVSSFSIPAKGLQVSQYGNPAKAVQGTIKLMQALKAGETYQSAYLKSKPEIKVNAEKHRGFELTSIALQYDIDKMVEQALAGNPLAAGMKGQMTDMLKKSVGDGINLWFGGDGKVVVNVTAKDWATAKGVLDEYLDKKSPLGKQQAFQEARKQLPNEATLLGVMDAAAYFQTVGEMIGSMMGAFIPLPPNFPAPAGKGDKSYLGVALTLQAESGSFDLWIPGTAANTFYKMIVKPLTQQAQ